jgi:phospholipid transport system substrate-binding protein
MTTRILAFTAVMLLAASAWANSARADSANPGKPEQLMKQTAGRIIREIQQNKQKYENNHEALYQLVDKRILPHFDFHYMSQLVLGRYWRQASSDQRKRFTKAFKSLLVHTYADSLLRYSNNKITWKPVHAEKNAKDVTVHSEVHMKSGPSVPIVYQLALEDGQWKVYNVTVDGVSLVINYRSSFTQKAERNGIDALIKQVQQKSEGEKQKHEQKSG